MCLGGVFDNCEAMAYGKILDFGHVGRMTI
jgi:hypothetical protein